jgi:hypothetical protein
MAVAYETHNSGGGSLVSSISFNLTVTSADCLWVGTAFYQNGNTFVSGVTFNGDSFTEVPNSAKNNGSLWVQQFYLVAPDVGTFTLQVTYGGSAAFDIGVVAVAFTGVDQTTPIGTAVTASDSSTTPSVTVTANADDFVVDILGIAHSGTLTVGANQTQRANTTAGGFYKYATSTQDGGDGGVMSWSNSTSQAWAISAVPIKAVSAAATLPHHLMLLGVGR